jgi:hypothetical protein
LQIPARTLISCDIPAFLLSERRCCLAPPFLSADEIYVGRGDFQPIAIFPVERRDSEADADSLNLWRF